MHMHWLKNLNNNINMNEKKKNEEWNQFFNDYNQIVNNLNNRTEWNRKSKWTEKSETLIIQFLNN